MSRRQGAWMAAGLAALVVALTAVAGMLATVGESTALVTPMAECEAHAAKFKAERVALYTDGGSPSIVCVDEPYRWSGVWNPESKEVLINDRGRAHWGLAADPFYDRVLTHELGHAYGDRVAGLQDPGRLARYIELRHLSTDSAAAFEDFAEVIVWVHGREARYWPCPGRYCWTHPPTPDELRDLRREGFVLTSSSRAG